MVKFHAHKIVNYYPCLYCGKEHNGKMVLLPILRPMCKLCVKELIQVLTTYLEDEEKDENT